MAIGRKDGARETNTLPEVDTNQILAALDLGTNNCRLLVARPTVGASKGHNALKVIDSFSRIVRLGEGVSVTGLLTQEAMERTFEALRACKHKLERHNISQGRYVATEACRRAVNAQEFLGRVRRELGLDIDVISNEEEAKLAFIGCASLLDSDATHAVVFDIGGGSTEFMWVKLQKNASPRYVVEDWFSVPFGVMNLSEKFGGNAYAEMYFDELVRKVADALRDFDKKNKILETIKKEKVQLLSTSGTVTTLAAIHLGLPRYDRTRIDGIRLTRDAIHDATAKILAMRPFERMQHNCIGPDRSDFIISGCAIFEAIGTVWPTSHITIADRGVREGIILTLLNGEQV